MNTRRTHTDSHVIKLGKREAKRQDLDIDSLELTNVEDMGFIMRRRRTIAGAVAGTLAATLAVVGFNAMSDNYDQKYDDCPPVEPVSWHFDENAALYAASAAAIAGCYDL